MNGAYLKAPPPPYKGLLSAETLQHLAASQPMTQTDASIEL